MSKSIKQAFERIKSEKEIVKQLLGQTTEHESSRSKRGLINAVGDVAKFLLGTLDDDDATYYKEQIEKFKEMKEYFQNY